MNPTILFDFNSNSKSALKEEPMNSNSSYKYEKCSKKNLDSIQTLRDEAETEFNCIKKAYDKCILTERNQAQCDPIKRTMDTATFGVEMLVNYQRTLETSCEAINKYM